MTIIEKILGSGGEKMGVVLAVVIISIIIAAIINCLPNLFRKSDASSAEIEIEYGPTGEPHER
ncbi:MAG: hypothetical protein V1804_01360 [Patescibacteria group bacterium]